MYIKMLKSNQELKKFYFIFKILNACESISYQCDYILHEMHLTCQLIFHDFSMIIVVLVKNKPIQSRLNLLFIYIYIWVGFKLYLV